MQITTLDPTHAADAARLHIAGQPNTFLTTLGPDVLTTFYRALPQSPTAFGFTAIEDTVAAQSKIQNPKSKMLVGFISATTSTGQLFLQLGTRHLPAFLPPLLRRFAQRPGLLLHCMQTVFYPFLHGANADKASRDAFSVPTAELLSVMVEPDWRSQGIGAHLLDALVAECRQRTIGALDVTVAADNDGAQRFYARHGFVRQQRFTLYGRPMYSFRRLIG